MSCDINEQSAGMAALSGFGNGLAGIVGASGFWNPVDSTDFKETTQNFSDLQDKWNNLENNWKNKVNQEQSIFLDEQLQLLQTVEDFNKTLEDEKITENTLFIQIIMGILLIIIIYLIVL
jgi:hypothetical protein